MAGAAPLLTSRIFGVVAEASKVAVAAWATLWIEPWVEETIPSLPEPLSFFLAAVTAAIVLELIFQILFGWPEIRVQWTDDSESAPLSEVRAKIRGSTSDSQALKFEVQVASGGWLAHQLMRLYTRARLTLQIRVEHALIVPTCEHSSRTGIAPIRALAVTADDTTNGFAVHLGNAPRRQGIWHFGTVRWRDESTPVGSEFRIDYIIHHRQLGVKILMNILIRRTANAHVFRVVGP